MVKSFDQSERVLRAGWTAATALFRGAVDQQADACEENERDGGGTFGSTSEPKVVWLGLEDHGGLEALVAALEAKLGAAGFAPPEKPFRAHLTLGRAKDRHTQCRASMKRFAVRRIQQQASRFLPLVPRPAQDGHDGGAVFAQVAVAARCLRGRVRLSSSSWASPSMSTPPACIFQWRSHSIRSRSSPPPLPASWRSELTSGVSSR